eukprot:1161281-Pelagomonas_calceolata.AAC.1
MSLEHYQSIGKCRCKVFHKATQYAKPRKGGQPHQDTPALLDRQHERSWTSLLSLWKPEEDSHCVQTFSKGTNLF